VSFLLYRSTTLRFETKAARRLSGARGQLPVFFLPHSNLQGIKEQRKVFSFSFFKLAPTLFMCYVLFGMFFFYCKKGFFLWSIFLV